MKTLPPSSSWMRLCVAAACLPATMALAAAPTDFPGRSIVLSEDQAVTLALSRHAGLEAAQQRAEAGAVQVQTASFLATPLLKLGAQGPSTAESDAARKRSVGIEWSPPAPGESRLRQGLLEHRRDELTHTASVTRQRLAAEVRSVHATLRVQEALFEESSRTMALWDRLRGIGQAQVTAHRRTRTEWSALLVDMAAAQDAHQQIAAAREDTRARLQSLLADSGVPPVVGRESLEDAHPHTQVEGKAAMVSALRDRPELSALLARCRGADVEEDLSRRADRLWFKDVELSYSTSAGQKNPSWGVQFSLPLPVVGTPAGSVAVRDTRRQACEADQRELSRQIRDEVVRAQAHLDAARQSWRRQQELMPLHDDAVRQEQDALKAARADAAEVVQQEIRRSQVRISALRQLMVVRQAEIDLALASARVSPSP